MNARLFAAKDVALPEEGAAWTGETLRPLAFRQNPDEPWAVTMNSPVWREVEIASGNGHLATTTFSAPTACRRSATKCA